jgi:SpoVK/Ycf46/Vps4 family AAA+-type ATPase
MSAQHPPLHPGALALQVAAEAGMTLLCLPPSAVLSKWSGESEKMLRATFQAAAALRPCAIFMVCGAASC